MSLVSWQKQALIHVRLPRSLEGRMKRRWGQDQQHNGIVLEPWTSSLIAGTIDRLGPSVVGSSSVFGHFQDAMKSFTWSKSAKADKAPRVASGNVCSSCRQLERACVAHFQLLRERPDHQHGVSTIQLHDNFAALLVSAQNGCHLCRCWVRALVGECTSSTIRQDLVQSPLPIIATSPFTVASPLQSGIFAGRPAHYFRIRSTVKATLRLGGINNAEFKALIDRDWSASIQLARSWLRECHGKHTLCSELSQDKVLPTRLMDISTGQIRIVAGKALPRSSRYIALSYCWGGDQAMKLMRSTAAQLTAGTSPIALSQTVQDAIAFCRDLEIQYLWVDALCIMQEDHGEDWKREATNIHRIYGNAYCTLSVCSAAHASEGVLEVHEPFELPIDPQFCRLMDMIPFTSRKTLSQIRTNAAIASRGWIFQEELLSPRIIYWSSHGLYWSCSEKKVAENGTSMNDTDELFPQVKAATSLDPHEFRRTEDPLLLWDDMITAFSTRDFTQPEDRLPAVSGLASLIAAATKDEYVTGLWKSRLPGQLLWAVTDSLTSDQGALSTDGASLQPPSWSWASIAPGRKIVMPKQASLTAQLIANERPMSGVTLRLRGRTRRMTQGLRRRSAYPKKDDTMTGARFSELMKHPAVWAVGKQEILLCVDWRRPIIILVDGRMPVSFDDLICFEINYMGLLLLQPVTGSQPLVYRRIGCAQSHRASDFFDGEKIVEVVLV